MKRAGRLTTVTVIAMAMAGVLGCKRLDAEANAGASAEAEAIARAEAIEKAEATEKAEAKAKAEAEAQAARAITDAAREAAAAAAAGIDSAGVIRRARVPGIGFAAVKADREVVLGGAGMADVSTKATVTGDTVFEAASIGKTIIAACVMQLVEDRRLDLDEDVARFLDFAVRHPRFPDPITMRLLLTHRASVRDRSADLWTTAKGNPLEDFERAYFTTKDGRPRADAFLDARPGTAMKYSNAGAALAALVVEKITGEDFAAFSLRRIFVPLRMTSTSWSAGDASGSVATPYRTNERGFVALPQASHAVYPVVDLRSSAHDLGRFARAILNGGELEGARILSPASTQRMLEAQPAGRQPAARAVDRDQALAWQLRKLGGARVAGHEGEDAGASAALFLDLQAGTGAVALANGDAFGSSDPKRAAAIQGMMVDLLARARGR